MSIEVKAICRHLEQFHPLQARPPSPTATIKVELYARRSDIKVKTKGRCLAADCGHQCESVIVYRVLGLQDARRADVIVEPLSSPIEPRF